MTTQGATAASTVWQEFISAVRTAAEGVPVEQWWSVWHSQRARTTFYADVLFKHVARAMNAMHEREWIGIDHVLWRPEGNRAGPLVLVESENDSADAEHEVRKLCSAHAPVRVLFSVVEWEDRNDRWQGRGQRAALLSKWADIRQSWAAYWPDPGLLGAVVGEWDRGNTLRFYSMVIPEIGQVLEDAAPFFERALGSRPQSPFVGIEGQPLA